MKGMSLTSKNSKNKSLEDALVKEDKLAPVITSNSAKSQASSSASTATEQAAPVIQQPVMLAVQEKLSARVSRDGIVESYEIKGSLTLTANNDESGLCSVQMRLGSNVSQFTFNTHPKINKALYDRNGLIQLKDVTKGFPSSRPVGILKWNYSNASDDMLPFKINCWPEEESRNRMIVTIEYTMDNPSLTLLDVEVKIPLGTSEPLSVVNIDGTYKHSASAGEVVWQIPLIDSSNSSGSFEFTITQKQSDAFFPININFSSSQLLCDLEVVTVTNPNSSTPIQYGLSKLMSTEEYTIE
jgi:coatomer subunit delta